MIETTVDRRTVIVGGAAATAGAWMPGGANAAASRPYRRVACEEAFILPEIRAALSAAAGGVASMHSGPIKGPFMADLLDIGEGRVRKMTMAGIDVAILSLTSPGVQNFEAEQAVSLARFANDRLADAIRAFPARFAGLATIAPQRPEAAAVELERAVRRLGLKGAIINSNTKGEYLDDPKFWPIFEAATALDVPVYIHPREPAVSLGSALVIPGFTVGWGYSVETGTHALRLIAAGVFDRFPTLKIVLGHLGETIPMLLQRLDGRYRFETGALNLSTRLKRKPSEYFRSNFVVTSSGMNYRAPIEMTIAQIGEDNVLFAADYPLEDQAEAVTELENMSLTTAIKKKIFDTNVARVFKV